MNKLNEMLKIADIHADRIASSIRRVGHLFPINADAIKTMNENDFVWIELLISRFGKLQDLLGSKVIDIFLEINQENVGNLTILDKLHKLEKLQIIEDAQMWKDMRKSRNHIAHEYPDKPELTAEYLNQIFDFTPALLKILANIKDRIKQVI